MNINIYTFLVILLLNISIINAFTLNVLSFFYNGSDDNFMEIIRRYNKQNEDNNIDVTINVVPLNENNQTMKIEDYTNTIASLCIKKSTKYDVYIYYDYNIQSIASHLVNFKDYVDDEFINRFPPELINNSKTSEGKIVGIPFSLTFFAFYANELLLSKYGLEIPKTWEEVVKTGKYILTQERELYNNTSLIGFNGLLSRDENGDLSLQSFFHSYRDSNNHPKITYDSQNAKDALAMIKKLKEEISSDEIFLSDLSLTFNKLFSGQALFIDLFYMGRLPFYKATALPGKNDKVSGTTCSSSNLLINKYISDDKKNAAVDFIKYITSDEIQREFFLSGQAFSPINKLYDEEACQNIDCEVALGAQPYSFTLDEPEFLDKKFYSNKIKEYAYDYIYGNTALNDVIKKIVDLKKIYSVSLGTDDSSIGLNILIISIVILFLMCTFLTIYIVKTKCKTKSKFFPNDLWILSLVGTAIMVCANFTVFGEVTAAKCYLQTTIFNVGFYINISPIMVQVISNFPTSNKYTKWFGQQKNKYTFICSMILVQLFLIGLSMIKSYTVDIVIIENGENYLSCVMKNSFGKFMVNMIEIIQIVVNIVLLFFYFLEWNLIDTAFDIKVLFSLSVLDILCSIIYHVLKRIDFNNFIYSNLVSFLVITILPITNFIFVYLLKIKVLITGKSSSMENIMDEIRKSTGKNNTGTTNSSAIRSSAKYSSNSYPSEQKSQSENESVQSNNSVMGNIMKYHFQQTRN